ncbi:xaa-Pro dipeptidase-like [Condylostylus longicornis]|uniref:xaa-Pro dipeptidase-like n=1 Tax=Condylostylus longicornis TaxID=2530218 RepID=UPI00244DE356|nr:xaa-Pro dipeptidase-like [Condylostylus longicornis]
MAFFKMGPGTLEIPMTMFRNNRNKVAREMKNHKLVDNKSYILLQGGNDVSFNDTDVDYLFRQESYFQYMFGVKEPGCYGAVHIESGKSILFVPRLPDEYGVWMGHINTLDEFKKIYQVDEVFYCDELSKFFEEVQVSVIFTLCGINTDSNLQSKPATFTGIDKFICNCDVLHSVIAECRVIKSTEEIEVLRYVAKISSDAHKEVMKSIKPGMTEYQCESIFLNYCYYNGGCRHVSYTCICGTGHNSSVLHYGHASAPNTRIIKDGDMCLFDMGGNYAGYAADITCSFPVNGKFTEKQKFIYNAVLDARNAVLKAAKEGVSWVDMHYLANKVMLGCLKDGNMLKGDVDEMIASGLNAIFQPHGLGHLIGLDVHDVGGYLNGEPERPKEPGFNKLRFARVLKEGMYVTVEPGCYFIDYLMDKALGDPNLLKFINREVFEDFRSFGGVRIEDCVLIKKDGCENFAIVPRTVEEIEAFMNVK